MTPKTVGRYAAEEAVKRSKRRWQRGTLTLRSLRRALREQARNLLRRGVIHSRATWLRAVKAVFGVGVRRLSELPNPRQLHLFAKRSAKRRPRK